MESGEFPQQVDLTNCDREPIHLLGHIQSFGCFIALRSDWLIAYCSSNTQEYFGDEPEDMIGEPVKNWFSRDTLHNIRSSLQSSMITGRNERLFNQPMEGAIPFADISVHFNGEFIIIECEKSEGRNPKQEQFVRSLLTQFYRAKDSNELIDMVTQQLQLITGYDRVMLYRFLPDGSGEVVAESTDPDFESFKGLRYPASDIPRQARALYVKNLLRVIGDVDDQIKPILPGIKKVGNQIDLSFSTLRAVSPIHIEYLQNMGVKASLSVSILQNGKLWGLIACHHYAPKVPSYYQRTELELFAEVFALELNARLANERDVEKDRASALHNKIMATMGTEGALIDLLSKQAPKLQELIPCDGITVIIDGQRVGTGIELSQDMLKRVTRFLNSEAPSEVITVESLAEELDDYDTQANKVAGIMAIPVSRSPRDYLIFNRVAQSHTINWAGNPEKAVSLGPNGARLLPRSSFAMWKETHNDKCSEWTEQDKRDGESLRITLLEVMLRHVQERDEILQQAGRKHEVLISELNHRVRNILNLVNAIIMQTDQANRTIEEFVQVLTGRLVALASAHDQLTASEWSDISLTQMLDTEIQAYMDLDGRIQRSGEEVMIKPQAATPLVLVIHEMFTNAAKYGPLSSSETRGQVVMKWYRDDNDNLIIKWSERGGPPVAPPEREGFGMTLIRSVIPHELDGQVDISFEPHGVQARLMIPGRYIEQSLESEKTTQESEAPAEMQTGTLPAEALVVEDSLVIALDMQAKLKRMGIASVSVAGSILSARQTYKRKSPGLVVFDIHLGAETTLGLLQEVMSDKVPCIIVSGYGEQLQLPAEFSDIPVVAKPVSELQLRSTLTTLFENLSLQGTKSAKGTSG